MKITQLLVSCGALVMVAAVSGCGGSSGGGSTSESYLVVNPEYGAPGAYNTDTGSYLSGSVVGTAGCQSSGESDCLLSFQGGYASVNASNPSLNGFVFNTNAVGGVDWEFTGLPSGNCSDGYSSNGAVDMGAGATETMVCANPTTDFTASPSSWTAGAGAPTSVTFTAVLNTFPSGQYSAATTVYSTSEAVQWQGNLTSATAKQITVPVSNGAVGTHVVVFRNPSTNAVIGAGAYVVAPFQEQGCTKQPCTQ